MPCLGGESCCTTVTQVEASARTTMKLSSRRNGLQVRKRVCPKTSNSVSPRGKEEQTEPTPTGDPAQLASFSRPQTRPPAPAVKMAKQRLSSLRHKPYPCSGK